MNKNRLVISLLVVFIIFVGAGSLFDHFHKSSNNQNLQLNESAGPIDFSNTGNLPNILLAQQLTDLYQTISGFAQSQSQFQNTTQMALVGQATIKSSGIITMTIQLEPSKTQLQVSVDRVTTYNQMTISIPAYNFTKTVTVY